MLCLVLGGVACSYLPGNHDLVRAHEMLGGIEQVSEVHKSCDASLFTADGQCIDIVMKDGARLGFERVGVNSFGSTAVNIVVAEASGLQPRVASCGGVAAANFHREAPLGHHFHPTLIDLKEAVSRYREVLEEVEFWPQCPQFWETQDRRGHNYRYCARKKGASEEPPRPGNCR